MLSATTQIKWTVVLAGALVTVVASGASARIPDAKLEFPTATLARVRRRSTNELRCGRWS